MRGQEVNNAESVIRMTWDHLERAAAAVGRAFLDYPLFPYAVPDETRRLRATTALYGGIMRCCLAEGEVYTTPEVEGSASWLPPHQPFPTCGMMTRAGMLRVPLRFGWTGFRRLHAYDEVAQRLHRQFARDAHWYLWAIGVDPPRQAKGLGARLMHPVLSRADSQGVACYLETHKELNVHLYERHGFQVVAAEEVVGHPGRVWAMRRPPEPV
jgi:ribosomal protein S18 acetylase RimI-like enzyme